MERKSTLNRDRSPPDVRLLETQDLPATERILFTEDLDDTQLVEATQALSPSSSKDDGIPQSSGEACPETPLDDNDNHLERSDIDIRKDTVNPLKDLSNLPKKSSLSKNKMTNNNESSKTSNYGLECTEELGSSEEVVPSQTSVFSSEENDLTPEMLGVDNSASNRRSAELKGKIKNVGGNVPSTQSSGSSENPESTLSGSQPSSLQLSSSDHGSAAESVQWTSRSSPTRPKNVSAAGSGENLDVTQDLFLTEEADFRGTSLSPHRTGSQKDKPLINASPMSVKSSVGVIHDDNKAQGKGRQFRVPQPTSKGTAEDGVKPRQCRNSGGKVLKQSVLNELVKASPPLDSQDVSLRVSGSGSDTGVVGHDQDDDEDEDDDVVAFVARKIPDTPKKQVYGSTPELEGVGEKAESRDTIVMVKKLLVFSEDLVDCKVEADKTGQVISLKIERIKHYSVEAKELAEPCMPLSGTITPNNELTLPTAVFGGAPSDESWKNRMVSSFEEGLKRYLTSSFQKTISADKKESSERRESPITPLTSGRFPRKRKRSSSSSPAAIVVNADMQSSKPSTSSSPFKRPKIDNLRAGRDKIQTPKRRVISPVRLPPSLPELTTSNALPKGAKVFALWSDKMYYAAKVLRQSGLDYYIVQFHDGYEKELPLNKMCVINTFEIDDSVLAKVTHRGDYKIGVVKEVKACDLIEERYVIKLNSDGSLLELPRDDLSLSDHMIQNHRLRNSNAETARKNVDVDLGNVIHGKRTRSAASPSPVPGPSGFKSKLTTSESSSCEEIEKAATCLKITGVELEENNVDPLAGKGPRKTKGRKKTALPEEERLLNEYGPIPEEGCKLFSGLSFILTCAMRHDHMSKERLRIGSPTSDHSDMDSLSESDCFCGPFIKIKKRMCKSRLTEQLIAGGGRILTSLDGLESETDLEDVFVIANRPCLTAVYVHCLALGIKGVLFDAVIHCCEKAINFKEYIEKCKIYLDAGYSIKERRLIPWNEFKDKLSKPFRNTTINVYSRDRSFIKYWEKILKCAGATLIKLKTMEQVSFCTVIVAEPPVSGILRSSARESSTPIVSTDWIVQSLIHNEALPADWHSDFRVHCDDSD